MKQSNRLVELLVAPLYSVRVPENGKLVPRSFVRGPESLSR